MDKPGDAEAKAVAYLQSPQAIRERCAAILSAGERDRLTHFALRLDRLSEVVTRVAAITRESYPHLEVPYHSRWNHFRAGDVDRVAWVDRALAERSPRQRARSRFDLVVTSVLLDAGAGESWSYHEASTDKTFARSEGLAVASLHMFSSGAFSSDPDDPLRADAEALERVDAQRIADAFQVRDVNPLVGLEGRAQLLRRLGQALRAAPELFGTEPPRIGNLVDALRARGSEDAIDAKDVLQAVLQGLGPIWPGRIVLGGVNLGDVWPHPHAGGDGPAAGLVPFHKLSQWLTYSLLEPLEQTGMAVRDLDALTGLAEYRNGGLFVDCGVLVPKHGAVTTEAHRPGDEVVVEWRALTVALLDRIADDVRRQLGVGREAFPLAKVLEGGTWAAGRRVARELRPHGRPPLRIESDGTVF